MNTDLKIVVEDPEPMGAGHWRCRCHVVGNGPRWSTTIENRATAEEAVADATRQAKIQLAKMTGQPLPRAPIQVQVKGRPI